VREAYTAEVRRLCALPVASIPGCPWPATLAKLEAGERVTVPGWAVGWARDFSSYWLHADGRLEPLHGVGKAPRS
jgi:hypothetical protein